MFYLGGSVGGGAGGRGGLGVLKGLQVSWAMKTEVLVARTVNALTATRLYALQRFIVL